MEYEIGMLVRNAFGLSVVVKLEKDCTILMQVEKSGNNPCRRRDDHANAYPMATGANAQNVTPFEQLSNRWKVKVMKTLLEYHRG